MKKILSLAIGLLIMMSFLTVAHAGVKEGAVSITPFAGGYFFEGDQDLKESIAYGLRAGYNITKYFGIEGFITIAESEIEEKEHWEPWQEVYHYGVDGLFHFFPDGRFVPFLAFGLGVTHYGKGESYSYSNYGDRFEDDKFTVDYGAGLKVFLTENIALRADVRHILPIGDRYENPHEVHNDFLATLGVNFAFGEKKSPPAEKYLKELEEAPSAKAPAAAPVETAADSDKDGVSDKYDRCPGTPAGIDVDKYGCPSDADNDGVADYLDKCPKTPQGEIVDRNGCINKKFSIRVKIEFDSGKAVVKKTYHNEIESLANILKTYPESDMVITGHTDSTGDEKANLKLSQARADSVKQYLVDKFGIQASRIKAIGYGESRPIADNKTKEGRQKNRRIIAFIETMQTK